MLNALKKCFINILKFIFLRKKRRRKMESHDSKISAYQDASFGLLLNIHNNINMVNITLKEKDKKNKINELEEMKKHFEQYLIYGDINEIKEINPL